MLGPWARLGIAGPRPWLRVAGSVTTCKQACRRAGCAKQSVCTRAGKVATLLPEEVQTARHCFRPRRSHFRGLGGLLFAPRRFGSGRVTESGTPRRPCFG